MPAGDTDDPVQRRLGPLTGSTLVALILALAESHVRGTHVRGEGFRRKEGDRPGVGQVCAEAVDDRSLASVLVIGCAVGRQCGERPQATEGGFQLGTGRPGR